MQQSRLYFRVHSASGVFQRELASISLVKGRSCGMLIPGKNDNEYLQNLCQILKAARDNGLNRLNKVCLCNQNLHI